MNAKVQLRRNLPNLYPIHGVFATASLLTSTVIVFALMRPDIVQFIDSLRQTTRPAISTDTSAVDVARIRAALETERVYRRMGLTVKDFATHLAIPEHRLRALIHEDMRFRNFNTLLHHYRVEEVCVALSDPTQNSTPILTLVLSAGYQSIAPFNRAFREMKGMSPTEYRADTQRKLRDFS